jgi:hypothetical protein
VLPHRKYWVFRAGIDNPKFASTKHVIDNCTLCHAGGDDTTADRDLAHAGMQRIPGGNTCDACHVVPTSLASGSLHVAPSGFVDVLEGRGFDFSAGSESLRRFTKQCTKCHIRNAETPEQPACGHCHVSVPNSAGGGLVGGHRMSRVPDTVNNCTACHGSRVKDEYFGQNQALFTRNLAAAAVPADYPFRTTTLRPDVHRSKGMGCDACHYKAELHGVGGAAGIDRYGLAGRTECTSCHVPTPSAFHSVQHLVTLSCHVCHSQPYKQCFGCHTQEKNGTAYFTNNDSDPTRATRRVPAAWSSTVTYAAGAYVTYSSVEYKSLLAGNLNHLPDAAASTWWTAQNAPLPAGDALITFRIGVNPRQEPGAPTYALLRHVPIDADTFAYTIDGQRLDGLVPNMAGLPTWKYATPHNILRVTPITTDPDGAGPASACGNCHSERYSKFWLTDPIADSFGWVPSAAMPSETGANTNVVKPAPIAPAIP